MKKELFCLLVIFMPFFLSGKNPVILEDGKEEYQIGKNLEFLEDKEGNITFEEISSGKFRDKFITSSHDNPIHIYPDTASGTLVWIKFHIQNRYLEKKTVYLELENNWLTGIELYSIDENGTIEQRKSGNSLPFSHREFDYKEFVFELQINSMYEKTIYLKLKTDSINYTPIRIWTPKAFIKKVSYETYVFGLYFGIVIIILVYNLFIYFSVKDKSYIIYVFFILALLLFQLSYYGFGYQYLWPDNPWLEKHATRPISSLTYILAIFFAMSFLKTGDHFPKINKIFITLACMIFPATFVAVFVSRMIGWIMLNIILTAILFSAITTGIMALKKGYRPALFFVIGWVFLLFGVIAGILGGFIRYFSEFLALYGHSIGTFLELVFLSLGLADRINIERKEKSSAELCL